MSGCLGRRHSWCISVYVPVKVPAAPKGWTHKNDQRRSLAVNGASEGHDQQVEETFCMEDKNKLRHHLTIINIRYNDHTNAQA